MNNRLLFWICVALTALVYGIMLVWSLPIILADADSLLPFDLRPVGYSYEQAKSFLAALSPDGTRFYRTTQRALDTAFPILEALSLGAAIFLLLPDRLGAKRFFIALLVLPGSVFDLLENAAVAALLRAGSNGITPEMVAQASFYTQLKSAFVTVSMVILLSALVTWWLQRRRG